MSIKQFNDANDTAWYHSGYSKWEPGRKPKTAFGYLVNSNK